MWGKSVPGIGQKVQRPWGRNALSRTNKWSDVAGEAVCARKSGGGMKRGTRAQFLSWGVLQSLGGLVCLSCFPDDTNDLLGLWGRAVVTTVASIRRVWVLAKLTT